MISQHEFSNNEKSPETMAEINMTPLIDVLLVLVVMLMICIPIQQHSVNLIICGDTPNLNVAPLAGCAYVKSSTKPLPGDIVNVAITNHGTVKWDGELVNDGNILQAKFIDIGNMYEQPMVNINPDKGADYRYVAAVLASAQRAGLLKLSLPETRSRHYLGDHAQRHGTRRATYIPGHFRSDDYLYAKSQSNEFELYRANALEIWQRSDAVARTTTALLILMAGLTWIILVVRAISDIRMLMQSREFNAAFWRATSTSVDIDATHAASPFRRIADSVAQARIQHQGNLLKHVDLTSWITYAIGRAMNQINIGLQRGAGVLASIASTAAFIGLFGTVWSIYRALINIGQTGSGHLDAIAVPMADAMIMTALGLVVAVSAILAYNWLLHRNARTMLALRSYSHDLRLAILSGDDTNKAHTPHAMS